jgi:hypothetical protein
MPEELSEEGHDPDEATPAPESADVTQALYETRIGLKPYSLATISPANIEAWKGEISQILSALQGGDFEEICEAVVRGGTKESSAVKFTFDLQDVLKEVLSEQSKTLMAIGLWYIKEKGPWHGRAIGELIAGMKLLIGGNHAPESFLGKDAQQPSCLDASIIIGEMAREFGISGAVYKLGSPKLTHRFWMSDDGEVLDAMWGWARGGIFKSKEDFIHYMKTSPRAAKVQGIWVRGEFVKEFENG